jgi:hypothetical protein
MPRIIEASGPVVAALKRYDPGLRVRWSWEKRKWAVDAPFAESTDPRAIPKPVRFEQVDGTGHWVARLMPEYSERNIQFRDNRYVVCWAKRLTPALVSAIAKRDSHRVKKGLVGLFDRDQAERIDEKKKATRRATDERVYSGWDRFKFDLRKNPNAEDGTGVSTKGMKLGD